MSEIYPPIHGGSGRWFFELYKRLEPNAYVMVVQRSDEIETKALDAGYPQRIYREDLHVEQRIASNLESLKRYLQISSRLLEIVSENHVTAIHAARPLHEGLVARWIKLRTGLPYLCYIHGEDINLATCSRELKWITRSVLKHAEKLIANSNFTRNLLIHDWGIAEQKIGLLHPGVDTNRFQPGTEPFVRKYTKEDDFVLLTVGRLQERKGHDSVIRSVSKLRKDFPLIRYLIAGTGDREASLRKLVLELDCDSHVKFLGDVDEQQLVDCYRECDLFVMPNRTIGKDCEGFGIVFLEAQAMGIPVIAGESGGTGDAMIDGITGFRINCEKNQDITKLCESIASLINAPTLRESMAQAGRQFVENNFSWEILAEEANRVLEMRKRD